MTMPLLDINKVISKPGSERAILSIILRYPDKIVECESNNLKSDHFSVDGHRYLYSIICFLYTNPEINSIDALLIYTSIRQPNVKTAVDELGGLEYIESLFNAEISDNLSYYVKEIKDLYTKREIYTMSKNLQSGILQNKYESADILITDLQNKTLEVAVESESSDEVYRMGSDTERVLQERMENRSSIPGLAMGWTQYDSVTQGANGNDLIVIVGESKVGKSAILIQYVVNWSIRDGLPGLYLDTEMDSRNQEDRILSCLSGIPFEEVVNGQFAVDTIYGNASSKRAAIEGATRKLQDNKCFHIYVPNFSADDVSKKIRKFKLKENIAYAIFDYIKLPSSEIAGLGDASEYQKLGYLTSALKDSAGICDIPVITAAQGNKSLIGCNDPDANQLGGSYRILQIASKLMFLTHKSNAQMMAENYTKGNRRLFVKYQRNGKSNNEAINFQFEEPILRFKEV